MIAAMKSDGAPPVSQSPIAKQAVWPGMQLAQQACDYWVDAWQRSVLFLDVMRQRGNKLLRARRRLGPEPSSLSVRTGHERPRSPTAGQLRTGPNPAARRADVEVYGDADILLVPDLEAGNMLANELTFLANADAAGIVLGARVPIILTSRADSVRARMASCAVAALYSHAQRAAAVGIG
jgi:hypothetical protein